MVISLFFLSNTFSSGNAWVPSLKNLIEAIAPKETMLMNILIHQINIQALEGRPGQEIIFSIRSVLVGFFWLYAFYFLFFYIYTPTKALVTWHEWEWESVSVSSALWLRSVYFRELIGESLADFYSDTWYIDDKINLFDITFKVFSRNIFFSCYIQEDRTNITAFCFTYIRLVHSASRI